MASRDSGDAWEGLRLLFERYQTSMYDLAVRMVHDSHLAIAIVENAFLEIWLSFGGETSEADQRLALAFLVRNSAIDALDRSERQVAAEVTPHESGLFSPATPADPSSSTVVLADLEHADVAWQAVAALNPTDYSLLHLHLRTGLTTAELAQGLGERPGVVLTTLSRLEATIQESVNDALLASRGGLACPELAAIIGQNPSEPLDPNLRFAVRHHFHRCPVCRSSALAFPSAELLFATLPIVSLASEEQRALWDRIAERAGQGEHVPLPLTGAPRPLERGWPARWNQLKSISPVLLLGVVIPAVIVVGLIVVANLVWGVHDPGDIHSISHTIGKMSSDTVVTVVWTAQSNVAGYSVAWTQGRRDLPIDQPNLPGTATSATSPTLDVGTWYFHLRTESQNGAWTSTVHLGPFVIQPVPQSDTPTETPLPPTTTPISPSPALPTVAARIVPTVPPIPTEAPPTRPVITPTSTRVTRPTTSTATAATTTAVTQTTTPGSTTATELPTATPTPTMTLSPTVTLTKTASGSLTPTASTTGSVTVTPNQTIAVSRTITATARASVLPTASATPTLTPAATATHAPGATSSPTLTHVAQ